MNKALFFNDETYLSFFLTLKNLHSRIGVKKVWPSFWMKRTTPGVLLYTTQVVKATLDHWKTSSSLVLASTWKITIMKARYILLPGNDTFIAWDKQKKIVFSHNHILIAVILTTHTASKFIETRLNCVALKKLYINTKVCTFLI